MQELVSRETNATQIPTQRAEEVIVEVKMENATASEENEGQNKSITSGACCEKKRKIGVSNSSKHEESEKGNKHLRNNGKEKLECESSQLQAAETTQNEKKDNKEKMGRENDETNILCEDVSVMNEKKLRNGKKIEGVKYYRSSLKMGKGEESDDGNKKERRKGKGILGAENHQSHMDSKENVVVNKADYQSLRRERGLFHPSTQNIHPLHNKLKPDFSSKVDEEIKDEEKDYRMMGKQKCGSHSFSIREYVLSKKWKNIEVKKFRWWQCEDCVKELVAEFEMQNAVASKENEVEIKSTPSDACCERKRKIDVCNSSEHEEAEKGNKQLRNKGKEKLECESTQNESKDKMGRENDEPNMFEEVGVMNEIKLGNTGKKIEGVKYYRSSLKMGMQGEKCDDGNKNERIKGKGIQGAQNSQSPHMDTKQNADYQSLRRDKGLFHISTPNMLPLHNKLKLDFSAGKVMYEEKMKDEEDTDLDVDIKMQRGQLMAMNQYRRAVTEKQEIQKRIHTLKGVYGNQTSPFISRPTNFQTPNQATTIMNTTNGFAMHSGSPTTFKNINSISASSAHPHPNFLFQQGNIHNFASHPNYTRGSSLQNSHFLHNGRGPITNLDPRVSVNQLRPTTPQSSFSFLNTTAPSAMHMGFNLNSNNNFTLQQGMPLLYQQPLTSSYASMSFRPQQEQQQSTRLIYPPSQLGITQPPMNYASSSGVLHKNQGSIQGKKDYQ